MNLMRFFAVLLSLLGTRALHALTPPVETGFAIQTISNRGPLAPMLDFDLDRFDRGHIAMVEIKGTALSTRACFVQYLRFDGMVWRNNTVNEFACNATAFNAQRGLIASTLSERDAPLPIFNILHAEPNAAPSGLSRMWLARMRGDQVLSTETIALEAVDRGIQLEASPDGRMHAVWRTPQGAIRHAIRATSGNWNVQTLGIIGPPASAPATAMSDDGRLLVGFVAGGQIGLWQHQNDAWTVLPSPVLQSVRAPLAVHFRADANGADIGVAAVNDGDQLFYFRGNELGFPANQVPNLIGTMGAFRLLDRRALPNQADPQASAWVALENSGQTQLASLPLANNNSVLITQSQFGGLVQGLALRGARLYAIAFDRNGSRNVQWHQTEHWALRTQAAPANVNVLSHVLDKEGSPLLLVRGLTSMQLGAWSESNNRFEFSDIPSGLMPTVAAASMDYQFDATSTLLSVAFQHPGTQKLHVISRRDSGIWQNEYAGEVDAFGSGVSAQIGIDDQFQRYVVHINSADFDRLLLTQFGGPLTGAQSITLDSTTSDLSQSKPRLAVIPETGDLYVSYQKSSNDLRVLLRRFNGDISSQAVTHTSDIVGEHHALSASVLGEPAIVFSLRNGNQTRLQYRYQFQGQWFEEPLRPAQDVGDLGGLALTLKNQNPLLARVLRIQNGGGGSGPQLIFEQRRVGFSPSVLPWRAQRFGDFVARNEVLALESDVGDHLMFFEGSANPRLVNALRMHQMDDEGNEIFSPLRPVPRAGQAMFCPCRNSALANPPIATCGAALNQPVNTDSVTAVSMLDQFDESHLQHRTLSPQLRALFNTTPAGRYYLSLHAEHGNEIIALTLRNPRMMVNRFRTLMSFTPGLLQLVRGNGAQERMSPEMLVEARNVWMEWRDRGSPALRATMQSELTRLNNLTVFNDMTFDQWFQSLTVGNAGPQIFRSGFE